MITVTTDQIREIIADDIEAMQAAVAHIESMLNRVAPSRERDEMIVANERLEILLYHLPENIAARGPFKDEDHVYRAAMAEVKRALPLLASFAAVGTA
jgi:hypothetical protein